MGEIGLQRQEYLYDLQYIDLLMIERGYERRHRHPWSIARWQTYHIMLSQCGGDSLQKAGISSASDLLPLPWDEDLPPEVTDEEIEKIQAEIDALNAQNE